MHPGGTSCSANLLRVVLATRSILYHLKRIFHHQQARLTVYRGTHILCVRLYEYCSLACLAGLCGVATQVSQLAAVMCLPLTAAANGTMPLHHGQHAMLVNLHEAQLAQIALLCRGLDSFKIQKRPAGSSLQRRLDIECFPLFLFLSCVLLQVDQ